MALTKQFNITDGVGVLTLSGGARLAAASGGLPQRITTEADGWLHAVTEGRSGVAWDPDGLHVWVSLQTAQKIRKVRVSDGATIAEFSNNSSDGGTRVVTVPYGCSRRGNKIYFVNGVATSSNFIGEINTDTLVCRLYQQTGHVGAALGHVFCAEPGKVWYRNVHTASGTYREASLSGTGDSAVATDTGQTVVGWDGAGDNEGLRAYISVGTGITWVDLATDVQTTFSTLTTSVSGFTGYGNNARGLVWDPVTNSPIHNHGNQINDHWARVTRNASTGAPTAWGARVIRQTLFGGPAFYAGSSFSRPAFAIFDDGSKVAIPVLERNALAASINSVRIVNLGVQRARWSWTPTRSIRMTRIGVPGSFPNAWSGFEHMPSAPSWLQGVHDLRKVSFWYSVNGGARVAFDPGAPIAVDVVAGQPITVDVDMQNTLENMLVPLNPVVGGLDGVSGPVIEYTQATPRRRLRGAV